MAGKEYPLKLLLTAIDRGAFATVGRLRLGVQALTAPTRPAANRLAALRGELRGLSMDVGLPRLKKGFTDVTREVSNLGTAAGTSVRRLGVLTGIGAGGLFLLKRELIGTASLFENLEVSLEGIEGNATAARAAMAFVQDLAIKTPFKITEVANAFKVMRGFGMDPRAHNAMQAIADQVAKVGGDGEKLQHIALQLGQAWSKGRLQAQDANILVENGIPVWGLLERAVARVNKGQRVTVAQLREMSEQGQLGTSAITELIRQMGIESAGASRRMMGTWTGLVSSLGDQWDLVKLRIMRSGAFNSVKAGLRDILNQVDVMARDGRLQAMADRIGQSFLTGFEWLRANGPGILQQIGENARAVFHIADGVSKVFGGWGNMLTIGIGAWTFLPIITGIAQVTTAIAGLNLALVGTPAGLILLGGATLILGGVAALKMLTAEGAAKPAMPNIMDRHAVKVSPGQGLAPRVGPFRTGSMGAGLQVPAIAQRATDAESVAAVDRMRRLDTVRQAIQGLHRSAKAPAAKITVEMLQVPKGTKVRLDPKNTADVNLKVGFAMSDAY